MSDFVNKPTRRAGLSDPYLAVSGSSFTDFLRETTPDLLPGRRAMAGNLADGLAPHGTTIVAATYDSGVIIAGDRRATMGNVIAQRDIQKVFATDSHSAIGIAGTAGIAIEMVRLFQVELEHYEKIEGATLSLDGKANRLAQMLKGNLSIAMQGLAVVPIFVGYDTDSPHEDSGRIFSYDVTGGCFEERFYHSIGSGSMFAKSSLKKLWRQDLGGDEAAEILITALYDAADDDTATGGPDATRGLYPNVFRLDREGAHELPDEQIERVCVQIDAERSRKLRRMGSRKPIIQEGGSTLS